MTANVVVSRAAIRRDTIRGLLESVLDINEEAVALITKAKTDEDHRDLGYTSWPAYVAAEFGGLLGSLSRDERRLTVLALTEAGMSTRAIAPIVGTAHSTVVEDIKSGGRNRPPDPQPTTEAPAPTPPVTGLDGKTYQRPSPVPRQPFQQTAEEAQQIGYEVWSRNLAKCVFLLAGFAKNEGQAAADLVNWQDSQDVYPQKTSPARLRRAATYLTELAAAWETQS